MNSNDAEYNVLNLLLTCPDLQAFIFDNCDVNLFRNKTLARIFELSKELFLAGEDIDNIAIYEKSGRDKDVSDALVVILCDVSASKTLIKSYCKLLFKQKLNDMISSAKNDEDLERIEHFKQKYDFSISKVQHISENMPEFEEIYKVYQGTSIVTGYPELDEAIGSFRGGDFITLGASTGTGKTSIALNIARQVCMQGKHVLYCSLEMPIDQLRNRFICINERLNALKFRNFTFTKEEKELYKQGMASLKDWYLNILTDYQLTPEKLKIYASELKEQNKLDFVVIDYLGLMSGYNNRSLYEKTSIMSRKIKCLATELNIPILVLVQLNREFKNRQDKRPILSDIRESGAIEQDSDFIFFAHREYMYNPAAKPNELEILLAKNRHGASKLSFNLYFDVQTQYIASYEWGASNDDF